MTGSDCRCPGCGTCGAAGEVARLRGIVERMKAEEAQVVRYCLELREENARLRAALRGLFKPDGVPYAQWSREMHAAAVALGSEDK